MKAILGILITLYLFCNLRFTDAQCILDKSNWTLVFNEEFNTNINDLKTRWKFAYGPQYPDTFFFVPFDTISNFRMNNGLAYFETKELQTPISYNNQSYKYTSADIRSKFDDVNYCHDSSNAGYLYGMFEIRCRLPKKPGQYPAYWLVGNTAWPPEIDVFEFNGNNHNQFFSSDYWGNNSLPQHCSNFYSFPFDLTDTYHTWTVVWTPTEITWFFDNRELKTDNVSDHIPGSTSPNMSERCKWYKMNQIIGTGLNWPDPDEPSFDPLIVDYIKVYKPDGYTPFTGSTEMDFNNWHDNVVESLYLTTKYKSSQDWILTKVVALDQYNSFSDLNVLQGGGKYFYKGDFGLLWNTYSYNYGNGTQYYSEPIDWNVTIDGDISVANLDEIEIPFCRKGNQLYYYQEQFYQIKYSAFPFNPINNVQSKILVNPNGLHVIYLGLDNNIWECKRATISSHVWNNVKITSTNNVTNGFIFDTNNYSRIYYRNSINQLVYIYLSGSLWISSVISTVSDVYSSLSISPNSDKIFYKTINNQLYYYKLSGGTWTRYPFNAITPYSNGQNVLINNIASGICISENPYKVYYLGTDSRVWNVFWDGSNWRSTALNWNAVYAVRDLKMTNPTTSNMLLSYVGSDNQIRNFYWGNCEVLNPVCDNTTYMKYSESTLQTFEVKTQRNDSISIYPNPSSDVIHLNLDFSNISINALDAKIINSQGRTVKVIKVNSGENLISVSDLKQGIYLIQIETNRKMRNIKFIKL